MKSLQESLFDKDLTTKDAYQYHPKTERQLRSIIEKELDIQGPDANLNHIDVSKITDMSKLFENLDIENIDISLWDVRNVTNMEGMFYGSEFNGDISEWDVRNVEDMYGMFYGCENFNCDLSKWNVGKAKDMSCMFYYCKNFNCDLSKWDVSKVEDMRFMFRDCVNFEGKGLEKWKIYKRCIYQYMFTGCTSIKKIPDWYK